MAEFLERPDVSAEFIGRLTSAQAALQAYITFLVGNTNDAEDILQNVNLALWRESSVYDLDRPFLAWAKTIAWYQVKTFRTLQKRDRLVFDEELLARVAEAADEESDLTRRLEALETCYESLARSQKMLLSARYFKKTAVCAIARRLRCSATSVTMLLFRIREKLGVCVEEKLRSEVPHAR